MNKRLLFSLPILLTGLFFSSTKPLYQQAAKAETLTADYTPTISDVFNFFGMSNDTEVDGVISRADAAYNIPIPKDDIQLTSTFYLQSANSIANGGDGVDSWATYSFTVNPAIDQSNNPAIPTNGSGSNGLFLSVTNYSATAYPNTVEIQVVSRVGGVRTEVAKSFVDGAVNTRMVISLAKELDSTYTFTLTRASDSVVLKSFTNLALDESVFINTDLAATYFSTGMWTASSTVRPTVAIHSLKTYVTPEPELVFFNEVTDIKDIYVGGTYAIAAKNGENVLVMSTTQNGNNRGQATGVISEGRLVVAPEYQLLSLVAGTVANSYGFKTINGSLVDQFLTTASSSSNYLRTSTTLNADSSWAITFNAGVVSVVGQGQYTRNVMQYNASSTIFGAYASASQGALTLYKADYMAQASQYSPRYEEVRDFYGIGGPIEGGIRMAADASLAVPMNGADIEIVTTFNLQSANSVANGGEGVDTWLTYSFTKQVPANGDAIPSNAHSNRGLYFVITNYSGTAAPNTVEVQVHLNGYHDEDPKFFLDNAVNTKIVISLEKTFDGKFNLTFKNHASGTVLFSAPNNVLSESDFVNEHGQTYLSTAMWTNNGSVRPTVDVFGVNKLAPKVSGVEVSLDEETFVYDGEEHEPVATVTLDEVTLVEDVDYVVDYTNNINVGSGQVAVTLIGEFDQQVITKDFAITAADASSATVTLSANSFVYTGQGIEPLVSVVLGDVTLEKDVDFEVVYQDNTAIGTGHAIVSFIGNYTGTAITRDFTITAISVTEADITLVEEIEYTGSALTPEVTVKMADVTLVKDTDYTVAYANNINVGTATVTITFKGIYSGTLEETFAIVAKDVSETAAVALADDEVEYTGSAQTPAVTVTLGATTLVKDTDYTVAYANNTNVGTATVTVTFIGNYEGTIAETFAITARDLSSTATVTLADDEFEVTGSALTPTVTVKLGDTTLVKDTDYTVAYANNTNVGTATITVTFIGNYEGTKTITFAIVAAPEEPKTGCFGSVSSTILVSAILLGTGGFFALKRKKESS